MPGRECTEPTEEGQLVERQIWDFTVMRWKKVMSPRFVPKIAVHKSEIASLLHDDLFRATGRTPDYSTFMRHHAEADRFRNWDRQAQQHLRELEEDYNLHLSNA